MSLLRKNCLILLNNLTFCSTSFLTWNHVSVPVVALVEQNVTVTGPGVGAASQLLDLQLEIEAVAPQQLRVLPGE